MPYQMIMQKNNLNKFFQLWFGLGAPCFFFGALFLLGSKSILFAFLLFGAYIWRVYDSFQKTCSRCQFYGSWKCGLPGKIVKLFFAKQNSPISSHTIQVHAWVDGAFLIGVSLLYLWLLGPIGLMLWIWPIGCYFIVYKPKQFHGLLWKL